MAIAVVPIAALCRAQNPEPTVVTVTGYPLPVTTVPASITLFNFDAIKQAVSDSAADLLSSTATLNVNRSGALGGYCSINIRGGKPNFTQVMIDGIQVNDIADSLGGAVDFSALSTGNIQQVEIVRGPLSSVYGSDSVSGVIQFVSRRGATQPYLDLTAASGSFATRNIGVAAGAQSGKLDYSLSVSYLGVSEQVKNDPYQLGTAAFHAGIAVSSNKFLAVTARFADSVTAGYPVGGGGSEYSVLQQAQRVEARQFLFGTQFDQRVNPTWSYGLAFDFFNRTQDLNIPAILDRNPPTFRSVPATLAGTAFDRYHAAFTNSFKVARSLTAHVSGGYRTDVGDANFHLNRTSFSLTTDLLYTIERLTLSFGARGDKVLDNRTYTSPHAGLMYQIVPGNLRLHATWGKGFKLPSFYSLADPLIGNSTLGAEYNQSFDAGLTADVFHKRVTVDAVYFHNTYRNLIDFSAQQFRLINRGLVETAGMEMETKVRLTNEIKLGASVNYLDWNLTPANEPFRNIPHWRVASTASWIPSRHFNLGVQFLAVGRRSDFQLPVPSLSSVGGYSTLSAHASFEVSERVTAFLRIDNLLNAKYHQFVGFPDPGLYVRLGVTFQALNHPQPRT